MENANFFDKISKKYLATENLGKQIFGAIVNRWWLCVLLLFFSLALIYIHSFTDPIDTLWINLWLQLVVLTIIIWVAISVCRSLTNVFSLRKNEIGITWCQISILIAVGFWIIGFLIIFDTKNHPQYAVALGVVGTILSWIFQDTVKGVVAFIHLRLNHLLCIGDWIKIPKYGVDGTVIHVTLTTVSVYNWDTTTSSIPTSVLHSDHFINLQNMTEGKTYGRRMCKSFVLDTDLFHAISTEEANILQSSKKICLYLPKEEINPGMINAKIFRLYLFHWLMNHPHVSQQPSLMVRWMEQVEYGMPLQIDAYIIDSNLSAFEWQQSQIIEHIIESMEWFGLRLYQSPSSYDASNSNIHVMKKEINHRKEF